MCEFFSAVYARDGRLLSAPGITDHHSALLALHGLQERSTCAPVQNFVRLELRPKDWFDADSWIEEVDEREVPEWFDAAARFDAFERMREIIRHATYQKPLTDAPLHVVGGLAIVRGGEVSAHNATVYAEEATVEITNGALSALRCRVIGHEARLFANGGTVSATRCVVEAHGVDFVSADMSHVAVWDSNVVAYSGTFVKAFGRSRLEMYDGSFAQAFNPDVEVEWQGDKAIFVRYDGGPFRSVVQGGRLLAPAATSDQ